MNLDETAVGEVFAEIGEVVSGAEHGRRSSEEVTLFKWLGLAVEDVATAELVYRKALGRGWQPYSRVSSPECVNEPDGKSEQAPRSHGLAE